MAGSDKSGGVVGSDKSDGVVGSDKLDGVAGSDKLDRVDGSDKLDGVDGSDKLDGVVGSDNSCALYYLQQVGLTRFSQMKVYASSVFIQQIIQFQVYSYCSANQHLLNDMSQIC